MSTSMRGRFTISLAGGDNIWASDDLLQAGVVLNGLLEAGFDEAVLCDSETGTTLQPTPAGGEIS